MDEQDKDLACLTDLDMTWGFELHAFLRERSHETRAAGVAGDLHAFLQKHSQEAPVAGDAGDGTAETMDSSQRGAVDVSSFLVGPKQSRRWIRLKGGRWTPSRSRQGGPKAAQTHQQPPAPTTGTAKVPPRSCRAGQLTSSVAGDGYPRQ